MRVSALSLTASTLDGQYLENARKFLCEVSDRTPLIHIIFSVWERCMDSAETTFALGSLKNLLYNFLLIPLIA